MTNLQRLLQPKSVAIFGGSWAEEVVRQCLRFGYKGEIWPVHPRHETIQGLPVYRSVDQLPDSPDAAFIGVNRELSIEIVAQLAKRNSGGAVCFSSGFRETQSNDETRGLELEQALLKASGEMPILGPNCYGYINFCDGALLWPDQHGGQKLAPGDRGAAIIVQSSNMAINISMQNRGLPLSYLMTVGNQIKLGLSELGMTLLDDPRVSCLGLHVEGFDSIEGMQLLAKKAYALKKPIAILKVGKSEQAQRGTFSHTASLAGSHISSSAFIKRLGMAQVDNLPALLDALMLLHVHGTLSGFKLSAMVCSGGEASLMADLAKDKAIEFPPLPPAARQRIQAALGPLVTIANPLDFHTYIWGDREITAEAFSGMLSAGFDLNILILDFPSASLDDSCWQLTASAFLDAKTTTSEPHQNAKNLPEIKTAMVACLAENVPNARLRANYISQGMPCFGGFEEILNAAEAAAGIGKCWQEWREQGPPSPLCINGDKLNQKTVTLDELQAKTILSEYGLFVPENRRVDQTEEIIVAANALGYPLAIKALAINHKTERNAVRLGISCESELLSAANDLFPLSNQIMLEKMVENSVGELLIGVTRDSQFGLVLTIAMGGILVELLNESVTLLLPTHQTQIQTALMSLKMAPLFESYRGQPAWDFDAVVKAVLAVQKFALDYQYRLLELDINPLMVGARESANASGTAVADALIILTPEKN
jgi:acyl-CoA synthetase (NDP forming)